MGLTKYRDLPIDEIRGNPLRAWGTLHADKVGTFWTIAVEVPLAELTALRPITQNKARVASIRTARLTGVELPPIELGVYQNGRAWIIDGNHRLIEARRAKLTTIPTTFTFVGF